MKLNYFNDKKVLVFGLGLLGGGVATANWLIKNGAKVTITDLKNREQLISSIKKLKGNFKLKLGGHSEKDIRKNDIIVINPDVSVYNPYIQLAIRLGKKVENEATIFYKLCPKPIVAVTGTRGKTTTAIWISHFLNAKYRSVVSGNSYIEPLFKTLDKINNFSFVANEIPSFHLELFGKSLKPPKIAVITNVFRDHLNRYKSFEDYAGTKANIFRGQSPEHNLILNHANRWTKFFLKQKPKAKIWFFFASPLPQGKNGVFFDKDYIYFKKGRASEKVLAIEGFAKRWGEHNIENLLASSLAAHLAGVSWSYIQKKINTLPQISFRQETIFENEQIKIINDTCATSPDGGIAAIRRFGGPNCILITGGTDRQLDYKEWAGFTRKMIKPENLIMLSGTATDKMIKLIGWRKSSIATYDSLAECFEKALERTGNYSKSVVLFSPASKSFEKFKNEYDRGEKFNELVRAKRLYPLGRRPKSFKT